MMFILKLVLYLFISLLIVLFTYWMGSGARREVDVCLGRHVLKFGWKLMLFGCLSILISFVLFFLATKGSNSTDVWMPGTISLVFFLCGLYIILEFLFVRIEFDDKFIYTFSPWKASRTIPWSEVTSCSYSHANHWHILRTQNSGVIRISDYLSGRVTIERHWKRHLKSKKGVER